MTSDESRLRLADYLSHMLEAVELARGYVTGISKDDFLKDRRTQQAVVVNLITIGEAASRIVNDVSSEPWFRNPRLNETPDGFLKCVPRK